MSRISIFWIFIQSIKIEKKDALDKALGYYCLALGSENPIQTIALYLSCISAIVRENTRINNVQRHNLKEELRRILQMRTQDFDEILFNESFEKIYDKMRSASAHGHVDIGDANEVNKGEKYSRSIRLWADKLIDDYIIENQGSGTN
jgi:hypothetical protein